MDYSRNKRVKLALMILALVSLSACSSSKVDDTGSPDTVGDPNASVDAQASTDMVPPADPNAPMDPSAAPMDPNATPEDPNLAAAPMDPNAAPPMDPNAVPTDPNAIGDGAETNQVAMTSEVPSAPTVEVGDGMKYKVKRGDTLMKIAFENYGDLYRWREIFEANRGQIQDPNRVPPGTLLTLNGAGMVTIERNGEQYLIKQGDTLGVISNDVYGTTRKWKKLWENNRQLIKDPNKIYAGFYLYYVPEARLTEDSRSGDEQAAKTKKAQPVAKATAPAMELPVANTAAVAPVEALPVLPAANAPVKAEAVDPARVPASKQ